jgi:hypothetical protein
MPYSRGDFAVKRVLMIVGVFSILIAGSASAQMMGGGSGSYGGYGGMMGGWWSSPPPQNTKAVTIDQAADIVQNYLKGFWTPDLKLAEVMEFDNQFYAEVREKSSGTGAFELLVNKWTGAVVPEPGPNMMWNTKYGQMGMGMMGGGMMGGPSWGWGGRGGYRGWQNPSSEMTVSTSQAHNNAQDFLDARLPGTTVEKDTDIFYGYYTMHVLNKDGSVYGMLGVNGYTGWVWYHEWHGKFIGMKEY